MAMTRREFLHRAGYAAFAAQAARLPAQELDRTMPNVVWFITDQQPCNTLRTYGNPVNQTPLTDGLAARGTRLDNFHLSAFPCGPSRSCLVTGRQAHNTGVIQNDVTLPDAVPTIAELLTGAGYDSGWFGKWHLAGNMYRGLARAGAAADESRWQKVRVPDETGFKYEQVPGGTGEDEPVHGFATWAGGWAQYHQWLRDNGQGALLEKRLFGNHSILPSGPEGTHIKSLVPAEYHVENFIAQQTAQFVTDHRDSRRPFLAVASFYGPHLPVAPPEPWDTKYGLEQAILPANLRDTLEGKPFGQRSNAHCYMLPNWTDDQFRDYIRRYYGFVDYIETCARQVLEALDASGRAQDTIVLWTSDHGDMVGGHGMIFKLGKCGYEELLRVPFLISYPGTIRSGAASDALCSTVDLVPTLIDLVGLPVPDGLDGRSFKPVLTGQAAEHRDYVVADWMGQGLVVRTKTQKLVFNHTQRDLDEVYDLAADPGEMKNLAAEPRGRAIANEMHARLATWMAETHHPYAKPIAAAAAVDPMANVCQATPTIDAFEDLGGGKFTLTYHWHCDAKVPYDQPCWSFLQFVRAGGRGDQAILFRSTDYPKTPVPAWQAGEDYVIGPLTFTVPEDAPATLAIRIGLYDPQAKRGPGTLRGPHASGNYYERYDLQITREAGKITAVALKER